MHSSTAVPDRVPQAVRNESAPVSRHARELGAAKLGLSPLDKIATAIVGLDNDEILELVRSAAEALADEDPVAACASRRRMLARLTATEKATFNVLVGMLGEHVHAGLGDEQALRVARLLDTLATNSCRRLTMLASVAGRRAAAISIEQAVIRVEAE